MMVRLIRAKTVWLVATLAPWPTAAVRAQSSGDRTNDRSLTAPVIAQLPKHITPATKTAIDRGLAYLARVQDRQGSWSNRTGQGAFPVAMTALAQLAMLMDGNTTTQGRYAPQVDRATRYLVRSSTANGLIARGEFESRPMYGHGFSMLSLSQLYGMTEDPRRAQEIHQVLSAAVQLTARAQSRLGGWIYQPDDRGDEGSVTITQVQALRSCRNAGIAVPKSVIDDAMQYLVMSQNSDGGIRYTAAQSGMSRESARQKGARVLQAEPESRARYGWARFLRPLVLRPGVIRVGRCLLEYVFSGPA